MKTPALKLVFSFTDCALKERLSTKLCAAYGRWLGGFRTLEIRRGKTREGFEIEALGGGWSEGGLPACRQAQFRENRRVVLASRSIVSRVSFNKYALDLAALEVTALAALEEAAAGGKVLLFDELGPMSMKSGKFSARVVELLFSPAPCLVFYRNGAAVFEKAFSKMSDTVIIELTEPGWAEAVSSAEAWLDRLAEGMRDEG
ncbi:MAG: nucleoside-triphosphatase [Elusimicrobiota bacterium]